MDTHSEKFRQFVRSLKTSTFDSDEDTDLTPQACALTTCTCDLCQNRGFSTFTDKGFISARICPCVKSCDLCRGTSQRLDDGKAKHCLSPWPISIVQSLNAAKLPARYLHASIRDFSNFSGNHKQVIQNIDNWLKSFKTQAQPKGLILGGNVGVGKTYLLVAVAKHLAHMGLRIQFVDFFQLISEIKHNISQNIKQEELINPLIETDVLLIDELGKGRQTDFEHTVIDQIVMGRYNQNKIILASTNCQLKAGPNPYANKDLDKGDRSQFIARYFPPLVDTVGERVYSRLYETTHFLELDGNDYRKEPR